MLRLVLHTSKVTVIQALSVCVSFESRTNRTLVNVCCVLQDRDSQKTEWIDRCIEELRSDTWVLPALKQIKEICSLFYEV